jgi:hypothetical protein
VEEVVVSHQEAISLEVEMGATQQEVGLVSLVLARRAQARTKHRTERHQTTDQAVLLEVLVLFPALHPLVV